MVSMIKHFFCALLAGVLLAFTPIAPAESPIAEPRTVTIAFHDYIPYYDVNGEGMVTDIYRAAFHTQDINVEMKLFPIRRGIRMMFNHEVDAFTPGLLLITDPKQREAVVSISAFMVNIGWFHYPIDAPNDDKTNFEGKILATVSAKGLHRPYLAPYLEKGLKTMMVDEPYRELQVLLARRVNYAVLTQLSGWSALTKNDLYEESLRFTSMAKSERSTLTFAKSNPRTEKLAGAFAKGLSTIIENGTYLRILERYWGKDNVPVDALLEPLKPQGTTQFSQEVFIENYHLRNRNKQ